MINKDFLKEVFEEKKSLMPLAIPKPQNPMRWMMYIDHFEYSDYVDIYIYQVEDPHQTL